MRTKHWGLAAAAVLWTAQAAAVNTEGHDAPYVVGFGSYTFVDSSRPWDDAEGFQLTLGAPLAFQHWAAEISVFDSGGFKRDLDGQDDYQKGLLIDAVRDFGVFGYENGFRFTPFALAGIGAIQEDVLGQKDLHFGANVGGGVLFGLPWWGLGIRTEGRVQAQSNDDSAPGEDYLIDYRVLVGLQVPLDFAPAAAPVPPPADCELAVVDPQTGRTDCAVDSDHDGVADAADRCPGTPPATAVDSFGCPFELADADADGVGDAADACPDTMAPAKVDERGCAIPQPLVLPDFTFEFDSAKLSEQGKTYLDAMSRMLVGQPDLTVEIIGHTDSLGSEGYNLKLSQQRAKAALNYLVSTGIEGSRLTPTGRGEAQPVATNETEEGRAKNRRVAFWLYVQ